MNLTIVVEPISSKAKNRFANVMDNNPTCYVEQTFNGKVFLASANRKYFFWISSKDAHWKIV